MTMDTLSAIYETYMELKEALDVSGEEYEKLMNMEVTIVSTKGVAIIRPKYP